MTQFSPISFLLKTEVQGFYVRLPFRLATLPGFHASHIPKGKLVYLYIFLRDGCERSLRFRFRLEFSLGLQTPLLSWLRACFFDRFSRGSRSPGSHGVFSGARVSESSATDERGEPGLEGYVLGRGDVEVLLSSVLEICFAVVIKGLTVALVDSSRLLRI